MFMGWALARVLYSEASHLICLTCLFKDQPSLSDGLTAAHCRAGRAMHRLGPGRPCPWGRQAPSQRAPFRCSRFRPRSRRKIGCPGPCRTTQGLNMANFPLKPHLESWSHTQRGLTAFIHLFIHLFMWET